MQKTIVLLFAIIFIGCAENKKHKFDEGIYGLRSYFEKDYFDSNYVEYFLLKVSKDEITHYGTVNTWGSIFIRDVEDEKTKIINDSVISVIEADRDGKLKGQEYLKLKGAENIIGEEGINSEELIKYLDNHLISGNYKLKNKNVIFTKGGKINNLDTLNAYSINPRFGTNWWYDYKTIKINNELWKFDFTDKYFILTKYKKPQIEQQVELSNTKITLLR